MYSGNRIYITLNSADEWGRCLLHGLEISQNSVIPSAADVSEGSYAMITGSVDSAEHNFRWKSLLIDAALCDNAIMKISAYAANTTLVSLDGRTAELDSLLRDDSVSSDKRLEAVSQLFKPIFSGCFEGPVDLTGRYIWIKLEFFMLDRRELRLDKIKLLLSSESMIDYLPETYRAEDGENGFLTRYLSIFDSIFFDMDNKIEQLEDMLDYRAAEGDLLRYLAEWLCIEDAAYIDEKRLREKIRLADEDHRSIGVKKGLISWIEREYGITPNIIEYFSVEKMVREGKNREVYRRLFGEDPYKFFVLLPEKTFANTRDATVFMRKLKSRTPAFTEAEVVFTRQNLILEKHTYLGVNSVLRGYYPAAADEATRILDDTYLGGTPDAK